MSPRKVSNFLKSKFGLFVVFVAVLFSGLAIYGKHQSSERAAARLAAANTRKVQLGRVQFPLNQGLEDGMPREARIPAERDDSTDAKGDGLVPFHPVSADAKPSKMPAHAKAPPPPKKIRYASLLASYQPPSANAKRASTEAPERFIPFGTLLKCKLVNTIDTANLETPVIAVLLEDVWQNGKKIVPANTLVHGTAQAGRMRDRVTASGTWRFVWQDGRELAFNGIALDREYDQEIDGYGITDGSAGFKGRVIASDNLQELKMLASAALSGFARGTQDRTHTALGTTITGSLSNGVREGAGDVFELYAQRTLKDIEENGYFVRVAAGKEFYVYVLEAINPQRARVAGMKLEKEVAQNEKPEPNAEGH